MLGAAMDIIISVCCLCSAPPCPGKQSRIDVHMLIRNSVCVPRSTFWVLLVSSKINCSYILELTKKETLWVVSVSILEGSNQPSTHKKKYLKIGIFFLIVSFISFFFILGKLIGGNEQTRLLIARTHTRHNFNIHWNSERAMKQGLGRMCTQIARSIPQEKRQRIVECCCQLSALDV